VDATTDYDAWPPLAAPGVQVFDQIVSSKPNAAASTREVQDLTYADM
jgi:hypothetical protein